MAKQLPHGAAFGVEGVEGPVVVCGVGMAVLGRFRDFCRACAAVETAFTRLWLAVVIVLRKFTRHKTGKFEEAPEMKKPMSQLMMAHGLWIERRGRDSNPR